MQILNCEQGTQEWLNARLGIITASNAELLLVNGKGENGLGAGLKTYLYGLIAERFTGALDDEFTGNLYTERGHELEPIVSDYYEGMGYSKGEPITQVGIILNHAELVGYDVGASPDRLIGEKGGLEIKTRKGKLQACLLDTDDISKDHLAQVQFSLWVTGRDWWDYISFSEGMPFYIKRFEPDLEMHKTFETKAKLAYQWLDETMAKMVARI